MKEGRKMKTTLQVSIRSLVEFIGRKGSISSDFAPTSNALEGTRLHQLIQKRQKDNYQSEVPLSYNYTFANGIVLSLSGRADGIIHENDSISIDEIKSTVKDLTQLLEPVATHLAQALVYAYIYAHQNDLNEIGVRMTYIHIESEEIKYFKKTYAKEELVLFFEDLMHDYEQFVTLSVRGQRLRDETLKELPFPYGTYRQGQHEMAKSCFVAVKSHDVLFIQAATGIGKTLSTLYPSLKAMALGYTSKIMYLTAKTITRQVALDSLEMLCDKGAYLRYVSITAKDKICFMEDKKCHSDYCPYANGHYDRINRALLDCLTHETHWTREVIEQYAKKHQVCPFEYSLDLYNFADVSVSDYNYAFDPKVNLKRAFDEKNDYTLLVDEAHNLVDRARQMYSCELDLNLLESARKAFKPKKGSLYRRLKELVDYLKKIDQQNQEAPYIQKELSEKLLELIENFITRARQDLPEMPESLFKDTLLDVFFMANNVSRISEYYNQNYITYYENQILHLFCLDPSHCLAPIYNKVQSVILFSATFLPIKYFFNLLGGKTNHKKLYYASPFPKDNKCLLVANDIEATFRQRASYYLDIITYLEILMSKKSGHYLVFFPSYAYMNDVASLVKEKLPHIKLYLQESMMSEPQKEAFLQAFNEAFEENRLFFGVLGGIFSEGIDLKGNQVVGVIIVSVGLPQICLERELIHQHFNKDDLGYAYAYTYPGFNKVLQAAGRLIRSMDDRGIILLLDKRYQTKTYLSLFPEEWHNALPTSLKTIVQQLDNFYDISVEKKS